MGLENTDLLKKALVPLAKRNGIGKDEAWEVIREIQNSSINIRDSKLRGQVNNWWRKNKSEFHTIGLGLFNNLSLPTKLPNDTYMQVCCLMVAEKVFLEKSEIIKPKAEPEVEIEMEISNWMKFWQKIARLTESVTTFLKRTVSKNR